MQVEWDLVMISAFPIKADISQCLIWSDFKSLKTVGTSPQRTSASVSYASRSGH